MHNEFPDLPGLRDFDHEVFACLGVANGRMRHAARHALHHLERAWAIRAADPEMALFRAIAAEEEAATALFIVLRQQGYENAGRLSFKRHDFKAAVFPFLNAVWGFFTDVGGRLPFIPQLAAVERDEGPVLELRLDIGGGKSATPMPPLNFSVYLGEDPTNLYRFRQQIERIATGSGKADAKSHIADVSNRRNVLLYAGDQGWALIDGDIDKALAEYQRRVLIMIRVFCLIFPYPQRALFIQQCIDAFLMMMGAIEDDT